MRHLSLISVSGEYSILEITVRAHYIVTTSGQTALGVDYVDGSRQTCAKT